MNNLSVAALFLAALAASTMASPAQHGRSCFIAKAGSKACHGAVVARCNSQTYLLNQAKANHFKHLVCEDRATTPRTKKVRFALGIRRCKTCKCFLVPDAEKRTCKDLAANAKFVKKSCNTQSILKPLFLANSNATACLTGPSRTTYAMHVVQVMAKL